MGYSPWGRKELDTTEQLHFYIGYWFSALGNDFLSPQNKCFLLFSVHSSVDQVKIFQCVPGYIFLLGIGLPAYS